MLLDRILEWRREESWPGRPSRKGAARTCSHMEGAPCASNFSSHARPSPSFSPPSSLEGVPAMSWVMPSTPEVNNTHTARNPPRAGRAYPPSGRPLARRMAPARRGQGCISTCEARGFVARDSVAIQVSVAVVWVLLVGWACRSWAELAVGWWGKVRGEWVGGPRRLWAHDAVAVRGRDSKGSRGARDTAVPATPLLFTPGALRCCR